MEMIRNGEIVQNDFSYLADTDPVQPGANIIVSMVRFHAHRAELAKHDGKVGVRVEPDDEVEVLAPHLSNLDVIAIAFPKFSDGRGFTKARLLRERWGYEGELRAVGHVLRDRLFYMQRCGINAFEMAPGKSLTDALEGLHDFSVTYQGAADDPRPLFRRRDR